MILRKHLLLLVPLFGFLLYLPWSASIDYGITSFFYEPETSSFYGRQQPILRGIYLYGEWPGLITGVLAGAVWLLSFSRENWQQFRKSALVLALTLAIGAGLLTNIILKNTLHRPRPVQVEAFGGNFPFRPFYDPYLTAQSEPLRSICSGHAITGFYFLTFALLGYRKRNKGMVLLGIAIGLAWGALLGFTRISQGGHFFTDVLFAAVVIWTTAYLIDSLIYRKTKLQ